MQQVPRHEVQVENSVLQPEKLCRQSRYILHQDTDLTVKVLRCYISISALSSFIVAEYLMEHYQEYVTGTKKGRFVYLGNAIMLYEKYLFIIEELCYTI